MNLKKNIVANFFGLIYVTAIAIIVVPFYLDYLGAEAYGLVGFFALMQSWMLLMDMGLSPTLSREVAKVKNSTIEKLFIFKKLFHSLEFIFIVWGLIISSSIVMFSDWISLNWLQIESLNIQDVSYCISLMGIMVGLRLLGSLYRSGIIGAEEQVWLTIASSVIVTLKFAGVLLVLIFIGTDIKYFFEYQMIIAILEFIILSTKFYKIMDIGRFKFYFSYQNVKPILPFAISVAYTGGIWIIATQLDKLLLSGLLPLKEYGYFVLVGMVSNAVLQISDPIAKALLPRMVNFVKSNREVEMLDIYKKVTQITAIIVFSVVGVIGLYSNELLYSWTGTLEAAKWGENILSWYVLGNAFLAMSAFPYYLQYAYGELKINVQFETIKLLFSVPLVIWSIYNYGAIGAALTWFVLQFITFLVYPPIVHNKFALGIHTDWVMKDILPVFLSTVVFLLALHYLDLSFDYGRGLIFVTLLLIGVCLLFINTIVSSEGRKILKKIRNW